MIWVWALAGINVLQDTFLTTQWFYCISQTHNYFIKLKQRKSQLWRRFWILPLLLLLSFCFDWEDISNTWDIVSSAIQTPQISSKIRCCESYFQLSAQHLDIQMTHCHLCLKYYFQYCSTVVENCSGCCSELTISNHSQTNKALLTGLSDFIAKSLCPVEQGWLQTYPKIFLSSGSCVINDILLMGCSYCAFCNRKLKIYLRLKQNLI